MKIIKRNLKTIMFSLGLATGMMLPASASAQGVFGDMLDNYYSEKESSSNSGPLLRVDHTINDGGNGFSIETFGQNDAPLGSGLVILIGAGLGYVALKKKEDEQ